MASGATDGTLSIWDLNSVSETNNQLSDESNVLKVKIRLKEQLHQDCINGVSLHPTSNLIALTSGQRRLDQTMILDSSDEDSEGEQSDKAADKMVNSLSLLQVNKVV